MIVIQYRGLVCRPSASFSATHRLTYTPSSSPRLDLGVVTPLLFLDECSKSYSVFTAQAHSFEFSYLSDIEYQLLNGWEVIVVFANAVIMSQLLLDLIPRSSSTVAASGTIIKAERLAGPLAAPSQCGSSYIYCWSLLIHQLYMVQRRYSRPSQL